VEPLEPLEGEAICADGTRPMVFVEPATSGASNKWIFYLSGEGGPCHGENCWVSYRYKQPLMGDPGPALSMSTMHPDLPRGASIGGDGIASGSLADPTSDYNRVVFNRCSDAASGAIESVPIPDGIPATMECAFPGLVGANETRRSYAPTYHRGFYVMTAAFNTFDVVGGVDLDGNGSIDVPSLADATHVAIAGSSDAAYWVGVAGDHLADEVEAIAGDDVDVRLLLDGYFIGGLDNEARHTAAPPAGFNIFDAPYTTTGLCGPLDVDGDGVVEACSDAVYQAGGPLDVDTTYFERASMEVRGTLIDQSCLEFHALVGDGDAPCYDRSHVLMHHIDTPYGVFADQEDQKLYDSEVSYFEGNVAWGPLNPFLAEYRTRILETARDVEDFWSTQREEGAMANEDVLLLLRKARRAGQPISAAHHVYFGSDVRMNLPMTQCERLGGGASMVLDVVTIEDAVDEWITNPAAAQARVFEDAVNAAAAPTWWVTSNGACVAPL
jgi:hypothetical protein